MSLNESIHHVTKVVTKKGSLGGDKSLFDSLRYTDREILKIEVTFKASSFASDHTFQETFVTKELTLFLDEQHDLTLLGED